uniref:Uncharacterized protein n=2 Tax=Avena sativa TaxID=4498 RepID=A0ACD5UMJ1_AVESA
MGESSATDLEMGRLNSDTTSAHGREYYLQELKEFGVFLDRTASMVQMIKEANKELNSVTQSSSIKEIKGRMEKDMDEVGKMAHHMKEKLNRIFQSVLTPILNNLSNGRGYSVTLPMTMGPSTMSMVRALKIKLKERENDLKNLRRTIWKEYLEVVQRRAFTVAGIKLTDEVVRVIHTGSVVQMFENALQGISPEQVVPAVDEIKERQAVAMNFDKKILELQQNFAEMAALVETREKLDKALNKVRKLVIRARSTQEKLRDEMAENDRLCVLVIGLGLLLCTILIFLLLSNV